MHKVQPDSPHPHKAQLLALIEELEIKADHYSRTDWEMYELTIHKLADANLSLLDIINTENETFLQSVG